MTHRRLKVADADRPDPAPGCCRHRRGADPWAPERDPSSPRHRPLGDAVGPGRISVLGVRAGSGVSVRRRRALVRALGNRLESRRRRDLAADGCPHHAAGPDRPGCIDDDHESDQGVRDVHAAPRGRDDRRLPGSRPLPLLRLLRGHVDPDVLHHRHLGNRASDLRRRQVLHLHGLRLGVDAGGDHRSRSYLCLPRKGLHRSPSPIWPGSTSPSGPSGCSSPPSPSPSLSRSPCSRSTPGSPMPMSRRPPQARCCSLPSS